MAPLASHTTEHDRDKMTTVKLLDCGSFTPTCHNSSSRKRLSFGCARTIVLSLPRELRLNPHVLPCRGIQATRSSYRALKPTCKDSWLTLAPPTITEIRDSASARLGRSKTLGTQCYRHLVGSTTSTFIVHSVMQVCALLCSLILHYNTLIRRDG
jgi:hypothetical protein